MRIAKWFLDRSTRTKLIVYFVLIIGLTTFPIATVSGLLYRNQMIAEQNTNIRQTVVQISEGVDSHIRSMERVIDSLGEDPRIVQFLAQQSADKSCNENAYRALLNAATIYPEIAGIMVVATNGNYVSNVMNQQSSEPLTNEDWYKKAYENPEALQLCSKPVGRNITNIFQYSADDVVSISKAVTNRYTGKCAGVILIDMRLDTIKHAIKNFRPSSVGFVYIMNETGEIVYSPVNPIVYRIKSEWFQSEHQKILKKVIRGKQELLFANCSSYTKWKTIAALPLDETQKVIVGITYTSYAISLLVIIFAVFLAILASRSIANPITKLRLLMKSAENGNFDVHFQSKYNDEIGQLGQSYNKMIDRVSELINLVQEQEKNKRKAEIAILQAQINPHFLYNTMDTIQWMAQEHGAADVVDLVENLTSMLRIGLSRGNEFISVQMEAKHVESYLMIQKVRYEDKLNFSIQIDSDIMQLKVIKLILQPLVENAIYHGIKEKRGKGFIFITGKEEGGKIHFQVSDNGIGMKKEKLEQIRQMLSGEKQNLEIGYGVFNVNDKIRLNFGDEYGLSYHSIYGEGTTVDVWHPILEQTLQEESGGSS